MHMSSASSRKSARRPAFSSDWFSSSPLPSTRRLVRNSSRRVGDLAERVPQARLRSRHAAVVPHQLAQLAVDAVDRPLALACSRARSMRSCTSASTWANAACEVSTFSSGVEAR